MTKRITKSISMAPDTLERLEQISKELHMNTSQVVTSLIWNYKIKGVTDNANKQQRQKQ